MNKVTKVSLIVALVCMLAGGILCAVGFVFGGLKGVSIKNHRLVTSSNDNGSSDSENYYDIDKKNVDEFTSIDVDVDACDVTIIRSDSYAFEYHGNEKPEYSITDGKFTLTAGENSSFFNLDLITKECTMTIYLPEDVSLESVQVSVDAGNVDMTDIDMSSMQVESDAGNVNVKNCNADSGDVTSDAGNVSISSGNIAELNLETDAGNVKTDGLNVNKLTADSDMGNVSIGVVGQKDDYNIETSTDLGNVSVDGSDKSDDINSSNGADKSIKATTDMGDISIEFN